MPEKNIKTIRNPARTRRRILDAAIAEFAANGFAGARVDAVARRARTNKRMLYHYFKDKRGLFRAAFHQKIADRMVVAEKYPDAPGDRMAAWFLATCADAEWVRMMGWESLQNSTDTAVDEASRRKLARQVIARIRRLQQPGGHFNASLNPAYSLLAMMSLSAFPQAFPQMTRLIAGRPVRDKSFQRGYAKFLRQLAASFQPVKKKSSK